MYQQQVYVRAVKEILYLWYVKKFFPSRLVRTHAVPKVAAV
jgi:hypothetical protein